MTLDAPTLRHLALVKRLFLSAVAQAEQPEPLNALAVLWFQDAVELFLSRACEIHSVPHDNKTNFEQLLKGVAQGTGGATLEGHLAMMRMNRARVALKHHGNLPAASDVERFRFASEEFFQANAPRLFKIEFDEISLSGLVLCAGAREALLDAESALVAGEFADGAEHVARALELLLDDHEQRHSIRGRSPFGIGRYAGHFRPPAVRNSSERELGLYLQRAHDLLLQVGSAVRVLNMGLDPQKWLRFRTLTPGVGQRGGEWVFWNQPENPTANGVQFCIDFVVDAALQLQELKPYSQSRATEAEDPNAGDQTAG